MKEYQCLLIESDCCLIKIYREPPRFYQCVLIQKCPSNFQNLHKIVLPCYTLPDREAQKKREIEREREREHTL